MKQIVLNRGQCSLCQDVIISRYRHEYKTCRCGKSYIDGGKDYIRSGGSIILHPVYIDDPIEIVREFYNWTSVFDKDNNLLDEPQTRVLKDLETEHVKSIIEFFTKQCDENCYYLQIKNITNLMKRELEYRRIQQIA